jgi:leucyl/phenylalanyl-tRNA--protein transferase
MPVDPGSTIPVPILLSAYRSGVFPMCHDDGMIYWHDPDPRAIFPLERVAPNARLRRLLRSGHFTFSRDQAFAAVIGACADREETWLDRRMIDSYIALHRAGHAHSMETWQDGELVGGVYGVAIGGAFFAESMFHRVSSAGKAAFHVLAEHLRAQGYTLLDTQYINEFTMQLGAVEVPRAAFQRSLAQALRLRVPF